MDSMELAFCRARSERVVSGFYRPGGRKPPMFHRPCGRAVARGGSRAIWAVSSAHGTGCHRNAGAIRLLKGVAAPAEGRLGVIRSNGLCGREVSRRPRSCPPILDGRAGWAAGSEVAR